MKKKIFKHKFRVIPIDEIMKNRCSKYTFINFEELINRAKRGK